MPEPYLSVIIPAYNEARRIGPTLQKVQAYLASRALDAEIVLADDGSTDDTLAIAEQARATDLPNAPTLRLLPLPHAGKGSAVRAGMLAARGHYRFMCDADLSMPIEELAKFLPPRFADYDIVIGSREGAHARRFDEPAHRHLIGRVSNKIIQALAVRGFDDTQCGFKLFTAEAAEHLFARSRVNGFAFDIEVLFLARRRGYRIGVAEIDWYFSSESKVRPVQDTLRTFWETLHIRWNAARGLYAR